MNTNARFPDAENDAEDNKTEINYRRIAKGLGWFSLALGAAEVAAPGILAHLVGVRNGSVNRWLLRSPMYGMRSPLWRSLAITVHTRQFPVSS